MSVAEEKECQLNQRLTKADNPRSASLKTTIWKGLERHVESDARAVAAKTVEPV